MKLSHSLEVLSKSSKYAVSTLKIDEKQDDYRLLKDYLYITPDIENDLNKDVIDLLNENAAKKIICLCGSSGDGKSEILTNIYTNYKNLVDVHLDATHSDSQHKSAVECLDEKFDEYKKNSKSLILGINVGMVQKFVKFGSERHSDIKKSFEEYFKNRLKKRFESNGISYFDFECYPRLTFNENKVTSKFISSFLSKLTDNSSDNPFYKMYINDDKQCDYVASNFKVLGDHAFQGGLIELFGLARLMDEQFLIPRVFVDYIFQILVRENIDGIIGNVFSVFDNEFSVCFSNLDPINFRGKELDDFYLEYATNSLGVDMKNEIESFNKMAGKKLTPEGIVRCSYLLKNRNPEPKLSYSLKKEILPVSLRTYLKLIDLYSKKEFNLNEEDECFDIIEETLVKSIILYANRLIFAKADGFIVSSQLNEYSVCNKINIHSDIDWIEKYELKSVDTIPIPLIINDKGTYVFNIDLKTIVQSISILQGHRPNRLNIEDIAKFDEVIKGIIELSSDSEELKLISKYKTISISKNRNRYSIGA